MAILTSRATGNYSAQDTWTMTLTANAQTGGDSNTVCIIATAQFVTDGVKAGDKIVNTTDGSSAAVVTVDSATQITCDGLVGGSDNLFQATDVIDIRRVPVTATNNDNFIVANTHTVTIDQDVAAGSADSGTTCVVNSGGILTFDTSANRTVTVRGTWSIAGTLTCDFSGTTNTCTWQSATTGAHLNHILMPEAGSTINIKGNSTYYRATANNIGAELASSAASGQANIVLSTDPGWDAAGGYEVFVVRDDNGYTSDRRTVSSYTSATKTIVVSSNLTYTHAAKLTCVMLTRNIVFKRGGSYGMHFQINGVPTSFTCDDVFFDGGGSANQTGASFRGVVAANTIGITLNRCVFYGGSSGTYSVRKATFNYCIFAGGDQQCVACYDNIYNYCYSIQNTTHYYSDVRCTFNYGYQQGGLYGFRGCHDSKIVGVKCGASGFTQSVCYRARFYNCVLNYGGTEGTEYPQCSDCVFIDCTFDTGSYSFSYSTESRNFPGYGTRYVNLAGVEGNHMWHTYEMVVTTESTVRHTASGFAAECFLDNVDQLVWLEFKIPVKDGVPVSVFGWLRKDTNYGSGTQPYVTLSDAGITETTWNSFADVADTWQQFNVTGTPTYDGFALLRVYMTRNGTDCYVYADDFTIVSAAATDTGTLDYWLDGFPGLVLASTPLSTAGVAQAVWETQVGSPTAGSYGAKENNDLTVAKFMALQ